MVQEQTSREKGEPLAFLPRVAVIGARIDAQRVGSQPLEGGLQVTGAAHETGAGTQEAAAGKPHQRRRIGEHIRLGYRVDDREFVGERAAPAGVTGARHYIRHGPNLPGTLAEDKVPG